MMFSFYRLATGAFTGRRFDGPIYEVGINTPVGCAAITGAFDRLSQRIDLETGQVVAYKRPASEIAAEQLAVRERQSRQRIAQLEQQQLRPLRELAIDSSNTTARRRLDEIDAEIAARRSDIRPP